MAKYSVNSTKQTPFKPKLGNQKLLVEAVTNTQQKILSFAVTANGKVKTFEVKKGKVQAAWELAEKFIQVQLRT